MGQTYGQSTHPYRYHTHSRLTVLKHSCDGSSGSDYYGGGYFRALERIELVQKRARELDVVQPCRICTDLRKGQGAEQNGRIC